MAALEAGRLPCSAGEGRILRLAASIAGGVLEADGRHRPPEPSAASVWVKRRPDPRCRKGPYAAAGGKDARVCSELSLAAPRQLQLGAQCRRGRRSRTRPRAAPPPLCRARASPSLRPPVLKAYLDRSPARSSASSPYRRDRRWSRSTSGGHVTRSSRCSRWSRSRDLRWRPLPRRNSCLDRWPYDIINYQIGLTCLYADAQAPGARGGARLRLCSRVV